MINQQPSLVRFDGHGARTDFRALPGGFVALDDAHHEAVAAPELHIRALADKDVAKGRMAVIAGPAHHHIPAADLSGKQHAVAVEGQEGVFQLYEGFKIERVRNADRGAMVAVAPGNVIAVLQKAYAGIVAVFLG